MHRFLFFAVIALSACRGGDKTNTDSGGITGGDDTATDDTGDPGTDADGDGYLAADDCDDTNPDVHPDADEVCNGIDDDCDGDIDEDVTSTWYADADGDGYGSDTDSVQACEAPDGYVDRGGDCDDADTAYNPGADESDCTDPNDYNCDGSTGYDDADGDGVAACEDCNDADASSFPGADEVCDGADNDCDGDIDEEAIDTSTWYADADADGYGDAATTAQACEAPEGYVADATDCDDTHAEVNPAGTEVCDALDNDCDGDVDEEATDASTWYADTDSDGYGDAATSTDACDQPTGYVADATDCDDAEAAAYPGADEYCDDIDNDCDGDIDEEAVDARTYYLDNDGDGYGDEDYPYEACSRPSGYAGVKKDCDDSDANVNPSADEECDGIDNDCDGDIDWGMGVPDSYATIGDALDVASDGDTICVAAGTYTETITYGGLDVTINGYEGADVTTIDGDGDGPVVSFEDRESSAAVLTGFTITGGDDDQGAGVFIDGADPTLSDLIITDNTCTGRVSACYGVGLYAEDTDFTMDNVVISDNTATGGSAGGRYGYAYGVGLYVNNADSVFTDVDVTDNDHSPSASYYTITYGPGASFDDVDIVWTGGTVSGNTQSASGSYSYGYGGGVYVSNADLELSQMTVADNSLNSSYYNYGGGIYANSYVDLGLTNVIVANNTAGDGSGYYAMGGGVMLSSYADLVVENSDIVGNIADGSYYEYGGGVASYYYADLEMLNTNVVSNSASNGGALGTYYSSYIGSEDITYSNFYDNGSDEFSGYSDPTGSDGNIAVDPDYTDTSAADGVDWDLSLSATSSCVDAGDPSMTDTDGSTADIGAYGGALGSW